MFNAGQGLEVGSASSIKTFSSSEAYQYFGRSGMLIVWGMESWWFKVYLISNTLLSLIERFVCRQKNIFKWEKEIIAQKGKKFHCLEMDTMTSEDSAVKASLSFTNLEYQN